MPARTARGRPDCRQAPERTIKMLARETRFLARNENGRRACRNAPLRRRRGVKRPIPTLAELPPSVREGLSRLTGNATPDPFGRKSLRQLVADHLVVFGRATAAGRLLAADRHASRRMQDRWGRLNTTVTANANGIAVTPTAASAIDARPISFLAGRRPTMRFIVVCSIARRCALPRR